MESEKIVSLGPKTNSSSFDEAIRCLGQRTVGLGMLWLNVVYPVCLILFFVKYQGLADGDFRIVLGILYFAALPLGLSVVYFLCTELKIPSIRKKGRSLQNPDVGNRDRYLLAISLLFFVGFHCVTSFDRFLLRLSPDSILPTLLLLVSIGFAVVWSFFGLYRRVFRHPEISNSVMTLFFRHMFFASGPAILLFLGGDGWFVFLGLVVLLVELIFFLKNPFAAEVSMVKLFSGNKAWKLPKKIFRKEGAELFTRVVTYSLVGLLISFSVYLTVDWFLDFLGCSFFTRYFGEIHETVRNKVENGMETPFLLIYEFFHTLFVVIPSSPYVVAMASAAVFLGYLVYRMAWFMSFLDLAVRYNCFDLEIRFREEAQSIKSL